jgi:signal peptidase I
MRETTVRRARGLAESFAIVGIVALTILALLAIWRPVRVSGASMTPALFPGDLVLVRRHAPARIGEVALLETPSHGLFLHRVVWVGDDGSVRTKGDANGAEDRDARPPSEIAGTVGAVLPVGRLLVRWRGADAYARMASQQNSTRR